jgi:putative tricarboxylic transport membrane protein
MDRADRISGIFWVVFSVIVCIESYRLGLGTVRQPGPGFLFFWASIFLGIMSLILLARSWDRKKTGEFETPLLGNLNRTKLVLVLFSMFLYALFIERLGFIPVTLLLFIFLLGVIEKKRWLFAITVGILVTVISYLIFEIWLQSQLPKGLLEFLRF